ncbi:MAG: hypothetical protein HY369_01165 [Candidatus Aenigmarchaeota archaeon]|nr:hypothetical protein [Candidatus Aenigmarchaeota archaeon]
MREPSPLKKHHGVIFLAGAVVAAAFLMTAEAALVIQSLGSFGYLGALIAGFFFSSALTTVPATASFFILGGILDPFLIALFGAAGAMTADFLLFEVFRYRLSHHYGLFDRFRTWKAARRFTRYVRHHAALQYCIPVVGALVIASPLPDELGIAILGSSKYSDRRFLAIAFVMNFLGIFAISSIGRLL